MTGGPQPKRPKARCTRCGKMVTLTHKTKTYPEGARLHDHKDGAGRHCYGQPQRGAS